MLALIVFICWLIAAVRPLSSAVPKIDFFFLGWAVVALDFAIKLVR